uniref:GST N-terminal domain-containing protein n=1 Tax=Corethron hystrix TaxID=216773 RepID=A0A7S1FT68_9STRA|mmetsp:Transcript_2908/g.5447  ORF Transcript_2908/g.5447 Transcript_2908/m.5447 type:complete len:227 (+) Transcript_2908:119-799(+)|eukprot:CAMPEP_0113313056 /NCGR_PEP_ID=MMETSP0010_2-20120614/9630_1 /TAXON_ID=216773 ORGANISM="Corethron hystrix, Strain 308" /NCGR_SAMPLE_ID=MMETSP0010_2 /ASSEMBLY_ACC=CAM_ASM_000155 /LENGTH=226 /DNA_ID=CAMNT_0000168987 /DNA_START=64 /DNA_END=744 /DNA_ORIENTATION=- /assembly_acc=CAM_ASM_000155
MPPSIKLTYFDIEGVAEPVRLALALGGIAYEDERIEFSQWAEIKHKTPHGKLPVMIIDGGRARTESGAMLRYVASLVPEKKLVCPDKIYEIEEAIGLIDDMRQSFMPAHYMGMRPQNFGYPGDFLKTEEGKAKVEELRKNWIKNDLPTYLRHIESMIERNGGNWIASDDKPTIADCKAIVFLRMLVKGVVDYVDPNCLKSNANIVKYMEKFFTLPEIVGRYKDGFP